MAHFDQRPKDIREQPALASLQIPTRWINFREVGDLICPAGDPIRADEGLLEQHIHRCRHKRPQPGRNASTPCNLIVYMLGEFTSPVDSSRWILLVKISNREKEAIRERRMRPADVAKFLGLHWPMITAAEFAEQRSDLQDD